MSVVVRNICPTCDRQLRPGQLLCVMDVIILSRRATRAYDAIRRTEPGLAGDALVRRSLDWLSSGHAHHLSPQVGCPFCILA